MATRLVPKRIAAPSEISHTPSAKEIPTVARGGTRAAAIATPARAPNSEGRATA